MKRETCVQRIKLNIDGNYIIIFFFSQHDGDNASSWSDHERCVDVLISIDNGSDLLNKLIVSQF